MPIDPKTVVWETPPLEGITWEETARDYTPLKAAGSLAKDVAVTGATGIGEFGLSALKANPLAALLRGLSDLPVLKNAPAVQAAKTLPAVVENQEKRLSKWEGENSNLKGLPQAGVKGLSTGLAGGALTGARGALAAGLGGEVGGVTNEGVQKWLEKSPELGRLLGPLAGLAAGGLAGFTLGPKQSVAKQDIARELKGTPAADWTKAGENAQLFSDVGAKTATAADTFPGKPRIVGLAAQAANSHGGEELAQKIAGREDDLKNLGDTFINRIGPRVDPMQTANSLADAANSLLQTSDQGIKTALRNRLAGETIAPHQARELYNALLKEGAKKTNPPEAQAYRDVARSLISTDGKEIQRGVQALSLIIKSHKDAAKNPQNFQSAPQSITGGWGHEAVKNAEEGLGFFSPTFEDAMTDFRLARKKNATPANTLGNHQTLGDWTEGPIGRLADPGNPLAEKPTPAGRLNAVVDGNSPPVVSGTARLLNDPHMTGTVEKPGPTVSPDELASALAQLKLQNRPADPGQVMRGDQNSLRAKQLDALLQGTGRPVSDITAPLRAADQMLHLHAANSSGGPPRMGMGQMLLRPFRTLDMMITAHNEAGVQREIAHLLQDPNNLPELRKIAMFDPTVRKQLSLMSGLAGGLATSEGAR